jgi:hypothetical protein
MIIEDAPDLTPTSTRKALWGIAIFVLIAVVAAGAIGGWWFAKAPTGAACNTDGACRSGECVRKVSLIGENTTGEGVCAASCKTERDCPLVQSCKARSSGAKVCTPMFYE